jgi:hypothetical protein
MRTIRTHQRCTRLRRILLSVAITLATTYSAAADESKKDALKRQLEAVVERLEELKKPEPQPAAVAAQSESVADTSEKTSEKPQPTIGEKALQAVRDFRRIDEVELLKPIDSKATDGVTRLQQNQRDLTTQKLGDQLIILDENP